MSHYSRSKLLIASTFTRGNQIFMVCELIVNPSASIVVCQFVLLSGAKIGVTISSPGPNNRTWSEASEADAVKAVVS